MAVTRPGLVIMMCERTTALHRLSCKSGGDETVMLHVDRNCNYTQFDTSAAHRIHSLQYDTLTEVTPILQRSNLHLNL